MPVHDSAEATAGTARTEESAPPATVASATLDSAPPLRRFGFGGTVTAAGVLAVLLTVLILISAWHITQGTSAIGFRDLLGLLAGGSPAEVGPSALDVLIGSRLPRVGAGILVGVALGVAGALFQSLARNQLASPDTLAVTGGAHFAVTAVAAFGLAIPVWASGAVAFAGGLLAAALVMSLAGGAASSTTRLVLAGTATALALQAATSALLILFAEETKSLYAWGSGTLNQLDGTAAVRSIPVITVIVLAGILISRRLDLLSLGDDAASVLGVPIRSTRAIGILLAVVLTATAVTLAGPIGFVGLCAPVITRLLGRLVPVLGRHAVMIPATALVGGIIVIAADAVLRAILGADEAITLPSGVTTTILGAIVLVALARTMRSSGPAQAGSTTRGTLRSRLRFILVVTTGAVLLIVVTLLALLSGERFYLLGDLVLWARDQAAPVISFAFDSRAPRIAAALCAGAALALSGTFVQASARNPLAEPGLLGITGGAGLGAVIVVTFVSGPSVAMISVAGVIGAFLAFGIVYGLSWRGGMNTDRLVLIGIGLWYGFTALTTMLLISVNPWDTPKIFTWLSGSTYGRVWADVLPVALVLVVAIPLAIVWTRELDLLALDDDTPMLVGVAREPVRFGVLVTAALLAALSVSAVGVVGFIGLVAPHAARALVGGRHARVIPVAMLLGAGGLVFADALGRTVIAPAQIPAGLIVALIGAPYFVYLLARSRA
ncbi:iron complex transport system permease protein [Brevibacterium sanguinis]|uniref:Iron complex transport system permease protein n=2 Tax=Brevibacterium TaxID=1696 RepID=A0A366IHF0_9MICO|nr:MULTISPECIES: iron ABC transporter permease [Brevibacterium]RBP63611.1 iron complex transport system permease protein [Brevibacterium sanguinis]RBP70270.1 iron complex transport system permease protein [Brevibacterium celere]